MNQVQSVDGLDEAEILEIVDHHNIGILSTTSPINFRNMSVGSVNTIIYTLI
jgi:manganese-dependent inorganic pyrophosphatase